MTIEYGQAQTETGQQQQQGDERDLSSRYRAIGIPAVTAAAMHAGKIKKRPVQQQQMSYDYED